MAYSYAEYTGTGGGSTGPFSFASILTLDEDTEAVATQMKVYKNGVLLVLTTDYTITGTNVNTVANVYNTDTLRISRETRKTSRYVDYVDATNVTAELLDLDANQLFFLTQEAYDLQTDAMVKGTDGLWAGRGIRISNIASAVNGTDAVNLNQLNAATSGAAPATLSGIGTLTYTGDGTTTSFALPSAISTITEADDVEVYINGLRQRPGTHYTLSGSNVAITPAPAASDNILLAHPHGVVAALLTANSVNTSSIQDDAVTTAKIAQGVDGQVLASVSGASAWTNITASYVSNFDTQVRLSRPDQLATAAADLSMGSNKITNLGTPTASTDAATKAYVDTGVVTTSAHSAVGTGSTTSINFSATATYQIGAFTVMVPYSYGASSAKGYFTFSGRCSSGYAENSSVSEPIRVFVPDDDSNGGTTYHCYFARSGGSNQNIAFTVTFSTSSGVGTAMALSTSRYCLIDLSKGTS